MGFPAAAPKPKDAGTLGSKNQGYANRIPKRPGIACKIAFGDSQLQGTIRSVVFL